MTGKHSENYLAIIKEHVLSCQNSLNDLSEKFKQDQASKFEYLAAERLLQILAEAAIGFAKYWVKIQNIPTSSNAYDEFKILHDLGKINSNELEIWKKIIGLRNVLVHDYLNIDLLVIKRIVREKNYQFMVDFVLNNIK